jgi:hypothetical protein
MLQDGLYVNLGDPFYSFCLRKVFQNKCKSEDWKMVVRKSDPGIVL